MKLYKITFIPCFGGGAGAGQSTETNINAIDVASATALAAGELFAARAEKEAVEQAREDRVGAVSDNKETRDRVLAEVRANLAEYYGTTPDKLDVTDEQLNALLGNMENAGKMQTLTNSINKDQFDADLSRATSFDPNFRNNIRLMSDQARSFMRGEIPEDVINKTIRNRAGLTGNVGIPGTAQEATARDLGMTSLDLRREGESIFQQIGNIRDQASPISRQLTSSRFLTNPETYLGVQEANNRLDAMPTPGLADTMGIELQGSTSDALALSNLPVPSGSMFGQFLGSAGGALSSIGSIQRNQYNTDKKRQFELYQQLLG